MDIQIVQSVLKLVSLIKNKDVDKNLNYSYFVMHYPDAYNPKVFI